jgi:predicted metal-dependent phosphoesterase TrpH
MNKGGKYYVPRKKGPHPEEAVEMIHRAGGAAIFAHPVATMYEQNFEVEKLSDKIIEYGFDGIEAVYYYFSKSLADRKINRVRQFMNLAQELGVVITGGSDFHGDSVQAGRFTELGMPGETIVPNEQNLADLKAAAETYR